MANEVLQNISQSDDERAQYRARLKMRLDYEHDQAVIREEGLEKGREQGRVIERTEIAKKLLAMGMTIEKISEATGLTVEAVKKLAKQ